MRPSFSRYSVAAMAALVGAWLLATPASAGQAVPRGGGGGQAVSTGGGSSAAGPSAPSGGGSTGTTSTGSGGGGGGTAVSRGGGGFSGGGVRGGSGGGHWTAGGGSGRSENTGSRGAVRGPSGEAHGTSTATGAAGAATPRGSSVGGDRGYVRGETGGRTGARTDGSNGVPPYSRPRDGQPTVGTAEPRTGAPPPKGGGTSVPGYYGGYFPYGYYGGLGLYGGYYGGYYDPYGYGWGDGDYGGGGGYDPQYYPPSTEQGALKLKVKPRDAAVYVDGYYAGVVNDFDGLFQKLTIDGGQHHVELRAPGFETLGFDVQIEPNHTTTYRGELTKSPQE